MYALLAMHWREGHCLFELRSGEHLLFAVRQESGRRTIPTHDARTAQEATAIQHNQTEKETKKSAQIARLRWHSKQPANQPVANLKTQTNPKYKQKPKLAVLRPARW